MTGILPGGCYPPTWPPPRIPQVPEPEPDSLDETVDWLTYSHPALYWMVHNGLNLDGAIAVSADWARLGDELAEMGDELHRLIGETAAAWQGEAAELAKGTVEELATWSADTANLATATCACITQEADLAATARNNMPAPPWPMIPHEPELLAKQSDADPGQLPSAASAFTSGDFGTAQTVVVDPMQWTSRERELHEQAAQTMQQFQTDSREVHGTVPQFAPPNLRKTPLVDPGPPPEPQPQPPTPTTPQQTPPGSGGAFGGSPGLGGTSAGPGDSGGRPAAAPGPQPGAGGGGAGVVPGVPGGPGQPAAASAGRPGTPVGGMPMGGMGGGRGGEDTEHKGAQYLDEDEDLWGIGDQKTMPPVIGEDGRRA